LFVLFIYGAGGLFICMFGVLSLGEVIVVIRNAFKPDDFLHKIFVSRFGQKIGNFFESFS
jgi:hypothetical protein